MLLQMQNATASDVIREISVKNLLAKKFANGNEGVEELCELIEQEVKFPGWPAVSKNRRAISILEVGKETILTPEYVMEKLGPALISSAVKIRNDIIEYEKKNEETKALEKKEKETRKIQEEILRRAAQTAKNITTRVSAKKMPPDSQIIKSEETKTDRWRFVIQGNVVRFMLGDKKINSKIAMWKGVESVIDPNGKNLIVQGNVIRQPNETELEILSKMPTQGNRPRRSIQG